MPKRSGWPAPTCVEHDLLHPRELVIPPVLPCQPDQSLLSAISTATLQRVGEGVRSGRGEDRGILGSSISLFGPSLETTGLTAPLDFQGQQRAVCQRDDERGSALVVQVVELRLPRGSRDCSSGTSSYGGNLTSRGDDFRTPGGGCRRFQALACRARTRAAAWRAARSRRRVAATPTPWGSEQSGSTARLEGASHCHARIQRRASSRARDQP